MKKQLNSSAKIRIFIGQSKTKHKKIKMKHKKHIRTANFIGIVGEMD